jgi:hypothetical protein
MTTAPRAQFHQALAKLASKARTSLPDLNSRIDAAVKLVLAGDVELLPDGTAQVASSTDPLTRYLVNGTCPCWDFAQAPAHLCKHRLAAVFTRRAQATQLPAEASDTHTTITQPLQTPTQPRPSWRPLARGRSRPLWRRCQRPPRRSTCGSCCTAGNVS